MKNKKNINSKESFIESINKREVKKCEVIRQQIREQIFYDDGLAIW